MGPGANEPGGFASFVATEFDFVPPESPSTQNNWSQVGISGTINPANSAVVTDTEAPYGPDVMRLSFPPTSNGLPLGGNAPVWMHNTENGAAGGRLYIRVRMKVDARWTNQDRPGCKLLFIRCDTGKNHYIGLSTLETEVPESLCISAGWQGGEQGSQLTLYHRPSLGAVNLVDEVFHDLEWLIEQENPAGTGANGRCDCWVDNVKQTFSYGWETNITMLSTGDARGWAGIEIQPTYGGGGVLDPPDLTPRIWWNIASIYASTGA